MATQIGTNTFAKGMHKDASRINQPEGTYREAFNIHLSNDEGEYHALSNERGMARITNLPEDYQVVGHTVVDDEIVLCLVNPNNDFSQLGVIKNNVYTKKVPVSGEDAELGFNIENPVDIVGRKLFNGDTIVYFADDNEPIGVINLDDPPENIAKGKNIIPLVDIPTITVQGDLTGGRLKGGVVQFMVRYLNKELVPTVTSPPTNPFPIVGSSVSTNRFDTFGADYEDNTGKAVELIISGLDQDYPFFELIAIEYEGATSAPKAVIAGTYDITGSTFRTIYGGESEDSVLTTVDEVIADPITYDTAKCVEQKDGRLFYSNLRETKSRFKEELQEIAKNIVMEFGTATSDDDYYCNPINCHREKTWRRGEVYSFGIGVMFKDGTTSYVYHIPGKDKGTNTPGKYANSFGGGSGELDTYISEDYYPANQGYPDEFGDGNTHIRHHIIPSNRFEPLFDNENSFNRIRVFFNNIDIPPALRDEIQKVILYREPRNTPEKRSKISQGFLTNMYIGATKYNNDRSKDADDTIIVGRSGDATSGFHYRKNFGFFNAQINTYWDMGEYVDNNALFSKTNYESNNDKDLSSHHGFYYSVRKLDEIAEPTDATLSLDATTREEYIKMGSIMNSSTLAWMGPEALLSDGVFINPDSLKGASLTRIAQINTSLTTYKQDAKFEQTNSKKFIALADTLNMFYRATGIYNSLVGGVEEIEYATFINNGVKKRVEGLSPYEVDNSWSGKFLYLHTKTNAQQSTETQGNVVDIAYSRDPSTPYGNLTLFKDVTNSDAPSGSSANQWNEELDVYDITRNIRNQYGRIENSQYVPVRIINSTEFDISNPRDYLGTYGDTYVTKYTTVNKNLFSRYFTFLKVIDNNPTFYQYTFDDDDEGDTRIFTTARIFESRYIPTIIPGNVYGSAVECFIESDINTYYRYSTDNEVPYYPRETIGKVFSAVPNQEENRNYNVQYSLDNILKTTYVSRPIFDDALTEFPNRTIYSERSNEDSKVDEYQIFKQNSFYDLPEDTGEIIDTFVWNNDLYSHTAKALWKNFVNTVTREANSIGDVVLGTGDLFSLPSQKILTSDGGYAGTLNQFGNALTPHGYFFVDTLQRKVFKLTNNLEEISLQGMQQWFDENIRKQIAGRDNPFWGYGITMGWDNEYKKLLITQKGTASDFTISYYPLIQGWGSFHNYIPNTYIEFDKFLYSIYNKNTGAERYQHNSNIVPYGDFAGNGVFPASVRFISNDRFHDEKAFDNFHIHSRSFDNVLGDRTDFQSIDLFTTMQCVTPYQDSGELDVLTTNAWDPVVANNEVLARWKKSHFQITIPRDNQEANLDNADGWEVASRLKGKYLETTFTYDNLNNREFIVNFIQYLYRIVAR